MKRNGIETKYKSTIGKGECSMRTHHVSQSTMHWRRGTHNAYCSGPREVALRQNDRAFPRQFRSEIISTEWMLESYLAEVRMGASQQNAHAYPRQFRSELFDIGSLLESERFWRRTHGGRISNSPGSRGRQC